MRAAYLVGSRIGRLLRRLQQPWTGPAREYTGRRHSPSAYCSSQGISLVRSFWHFEAVASLSTGSRPDWMPPQADIIAVPISWVSSKSGPRVAVALAFFVGIFFVSLALRWGSYQLP